MQYQPHSLSSIESERLLVFTAYALLLGNSHQNNEPKSKRNQLLKEFYLLYNACSSSTSTSTSTSARLRVRETIGENRLQSQGLQNIVDYILLFDDDPLIVDVGNQKVEKSTD
eukprot:Pgem_evm1s15370